MNKKRNHEAEKTHKLEALILERDRTLADQRDRIEYLQKELNDRNLAYDKLWQSQAAFEGKTAVAQKTEPAPHYEQWQRIMDDNKRLEERNAVLTRYNMRHEDELTRWRKQRKLIEDILAVGDGEGGG